jgi:large subunit ribosomal protein L9
MKIILREHVEHLGDRGDKVNVAAGYARNYLLPKGLAYAASAGSAKQIADQQRTWAKRESHEEAAARELAARIGAQALTVRRRAGEGGTLYGSVTNVDVAELLAAAGYEVDRRKIQLREPIKSLGDFEIPVKLHRIVSANIKVTVVTEAGQTLAEYEALRKSLDPVPPQVDADHRDEDERDDRAANPAESEEGQAGQES